MISFIRNGFLTVLPFDLLEISTHPSVGSQRKHRLATPPTPMTQRYQHCEKDHLLHSITSLSELADSVATNLHRSLSLHQLNLPPFQKNSSTLTTNGIQNFQSMAHLLGKVR